MSNVKVKLKIVLLAMALVMAAGSPAQALPFGAKHASARVSTQSQHQTAPWWKFLIKKLARYAMAAN